MSDYRDARREANKFAVWGIGWWLIVIVILLVLSVAGWGISVAVSGIQGQGDAIKQKNSAENWTAAQAGFEQSYQDIISTDQKIVLAYEQVQAFPEDKTVFQTYTGLQSYCLSAVAEYNADARSYLLEDFRASDLPQEIDTNNSTTDCKE